MRIKIWENTSPYKMLDVLEVAQPYKLGDDSPYGPVGQILPPIGAFVEVGIDQSVAVEVRGELVVEPENSIFKSPSIYRKITLYPIYSGGRHPWDEGALEDPSHQIMEGVTIENVRSMITPTTFDLWKNEGYLSRGQSEDLESITYAIAHRYSTEHSNITKRDKESQALVGKLSACLLLVRPMRRGHAGIVTGTVHEDGKLDPQEFNLSEPVEVPHVQKFFYLRKQDVDEFRSIAPSFLDAFKESEDRYEPFRMALQLFEQGHTGKWWKVRHILWWSAIEALFGNDSITLTARVFSLFGDKDMSKGAARSIYEPGDIPSFANYKPHATIGDTLEDLYYVRNLSAHGRKVPAEYLTPVPHMLEQAFGRVEILAEAASFIIRKTAIHILASNLLRHYTDVEARENYWLYEHGLNSRQAKKRMKKLGFNRKTRRNEAARPGSENTLTEAQRKEARFSAARATKVRPLPP